MCVMCWCAMVHVDAKNCTAGWNEGKSYPQLTMIIRVLIRICAIQYKSLHASTDCLGMKFTVMDNFTTSHNLTYFSILWSDEFWKVEDDASPEIDPLESLCVMEFVHEQLLSAVQNCRDLLIL